VLYTMSDQIQEKVQQYDNDPVCTVGKKCLVNFSIDTPMKAPVYFYYQLDNFYQNHRRYVKSRDFSQLKGSWPEDLSNCEPIQKNKDISPNLMSVSGKKLDPEAPANPCGLVAKSFFTDKFTLLKKDAKSKIDMNENGIAWQSDIDNKFKNYDGSSNSKIKGNWEDLQWKNVTDGKHGYSSL
jgi:hypothetical protein